MTIIEKIASEVKLIGRRVWCRLCGHTQLVENGLRDGWPKCCGQTMTIDPPHQQ
jgi:hypothetical protein